MYLRRPDLFSLISLHYLFLFPRGLPIALRERAVHNVHIFEKKIDASLIRFVLRPQRDDGDDPLAFYSRLFLLAKETSFIRAPCDRFRLVRIIVSLRRHAWESELSESLW